MNKNWLFLIIIIESTALFAGGESAIQKLIGAKHKGITQVYQVKTEEKVAPDILVVKTTVDGTTHEIPKQLLLQSDLIKDLLEKFPNAGTTLSSAIPLKLTSDEFETLKSYLENLQPELPDDIEQLGRLANIANYVETAEFFNRIIKKTAQVLTLPENLKNFLKDGNWIKTINSIFNPDLRQKIVEEIAKNYSVFINSIKSFASVETGKTLYNHYGSVNSLTVTSDGKYIISGASDETVKIWDIASNKIKKTLKDNETNITLVAATPSAKQIISSSVYFVKIWDLKSGKLVRTITDPKIITLGSGVVAHSGKQIISAYGTEILIWDLETGNLIKTLKGHNGSITALAISLDDKRIISGSMDGTIKIWSKVTGNLEKTIDNGIVRGIAVTSNGKKIVSGSGNEIKLWDKETGNLEKIFSVPESFSWGQTLTITPDNKYIVVGLLNGIIQIWNIETGKLEWILSGDTNSIYSLAITPNSKQIVSGSGTFGKSSVKIWNLELLQKIDSELKGLTLEQMLFIVTSLKASPLKAFQYKSGFMVPPHLKTILATFSLELQNMIFYTIAIQENKLGLD